MVYTNQATADMISGFARVLALRSSPLFICPKGVVYTLKELAVGVTQNAVVIVFFLVYLKGISHHLHNLLLVRLVVEESSSTPCSEFKSTLVFLSNNLTE